jgi:hypothetical protein
VTDTRQSRSVRIFCILVAACALAVPIFLVDGDGLMIGIPTGLLLLVVLLLFRATLPMIAGAAVGHAFHYYRFFAWVSATDSLALSFYPMVMPFGIAFAALTVWGLRKTTGVPSTVAALSTAFAVWAGATIAKVVILVTV